MAGLKGGKKPAPVRTNEAFVTLSKGAPRNSGCAGHKWAAAIGGSGSGNPAGKPGGVQSRGSLTSTARKFVKADAHRA